MQDVIVLENGNFVPVNTTMSHGTLRPQDLCPIMMSALRTVSPDHYIIYRTAVHPLPPAFVLEDDNADWWQSDECAEFMGELFDLLNVYGPEGYYWGAHPGDGSDFGYWEIED